jgi:hypothetical protein
MDSSEFVRLSARMPARPWRLVARVALAVATIVAVPTATLGAPGPLGGATRAADPAGTLLAALDRARAAHGREPLFPRADYAERARAAVSSVAEGANVPVQVDGAALVSAVVPGHDTGAVEHAMAGVVARLDRVLASELYTDAGVAVAKVATSRGDRSVAVAVVGWPRPARVTEAGCSVAGYCWGNRGLNRHLPWTRNRIEVRLSTANLPAGAAAVVRAGIVRLNQVPGLGADVVLAGTTPHTAPAGDHRFVVAFGSQASCGAGILACARPFVYGDGQVHAGAITLVRTRWDPRQAELWTGTVAHELGHLLGLTHYDARRADGYQLMSRHARTNVVRSGDAAGLRAIAPPGALATSMRLVSSVVTVGGHATAVVRASSDGLGGVRSVGVECYAGGRWTGVARVGGVFDSREREHVLSWAVSAGPALRWCRSVVTNKGGGRAYAPPVALTAR